MSLAKNEKIIKNLQQVIKSKNKELNKTKPKKDKQAAGDKYRSNSMPTSVKNFRPIRQRGEQESSLSYTFNLENQQMGQIGEDTINEQAIENSANTSIEQIISLQPSSMQASQHVLSQAKQNIRQINNSLERMQSVNTIDQYALKPGSMLSQNFETLQGQLNEKDRQITELNEKIEQLLNQINQRSNCFPLTNLDSGNRPMTYLTSAAVSPTKFPDELDITEPNTQAPPTPSDTLRGPDATITAYERQISAGSSARVIYGTRESKLQKQKIEGLSQLVNQLSDKVYYLQQSQLSNKETQQNTSYFKNGNLLPSEDEPYGSARLRIPPPSDRSSDIFMHTQQSRRWDNLHPLSFGSNVPADFKPLNTDEADVNMDYIRQISPYRPSSDLQLRRILKNDLGSRESLQQNINQFSQNTRDSHSQSRSQLLYQQTSDTYDRSIQRSKRSQRQKMGHSFDNNEQKYYNIQEQAYYEQLKEQLEDYLRQTYQLNGQLKKSQRKVDKLEKDNQEMICKQNQNCNIIETYRKENQDQRETLDQYNQKIAELEQIAETVIAEKGVALRERDELNNRLNNSKSDQSRALKQVRQLEEKLQKQEEVYQMKLENLENQVDENTNQQTKKFNELEAEATDQRTQMHRTAKQWEDRYYEERNSRKVLEAELQKQKQVASQQMNELQENYLQTKDENLTIQILMKELQRQIEQDLDIKDELHLEQINYLKNQLNEHTTRFSKQYAGSRKPCPQDISTIELKGQKDESYKLVLLDELKRLSRQLIKLQSIIEQSDDLIEDKIKYFDQFKSVVLNGFMEWHQQSFQLQKKTEIMNQSNKTNKIVINELKQLVYHKNQLIEMQSQQIGQLVNQIQNQCKHQLDNDQAEDMLNYLKHHQTTLQSEFAIRNQRQNDLKLFADDAEKKCLDLEEERENQNSKIEYLEKCNKHMFADQQSLLELVQQLNPQEQDCEAHLEQQNMSSIKECIKLQHKTIQDLKSTLQASRSSMATLQTQVDSQTSRHKSQLETIEQSMEENQTEWIEKQHQMNEQFARKEEELEAENSALHAQIDHINQELQFKQRQFQKFESRISDEQSQVQEAMIERDEALRRVKSFLEQVIQHKEVIVALELKLKQTQEVLDQRLLLVDQLQNQHQSMDSKEQEWQFQLKDATEQLQAALQLQSKLKADLRLATDERDLAQMELARVDHAKVTSMKKQLMEQDQQIESFTEQNSALLKEMEQINAKYQLQTTNLYDEIKKYQDSISYLSRQVDQDQDAQLSVNQLKEQVHFLSKQLKDQQDKNVQLKKMYQVQQKINKPKVNVSNRNVQTDVIQKDIDYRQAQIMNLEELLQQTVSKKNAYKAEVKKLRQIVKGGERELRSLRENQKRENTKSMQSLISLQFQDENLDYIVKEKDDYIEKLEQQLVELRDELDSLKEKIIALEMENISGKVSKQYKVISSLTSSADKEKLLHHRSMSTFQQKPASLFDPVNHKVQKGSQRQLVAEGISSASSSSQQ